MMSITRALIAIAVCMAVITPQNAAEPTTETTIKLIVEKTGANSAVGQWNPISGTDLTRYTQAVVKDGANNADEVKLIKEKIGRAHV